MNPIPADGPRRVLALWSILTLFLFSCTATLGFAIWTADQIVLRWVYGAEAVQRDQLRIVSHKPVLRVSNGDRLEGWGFWHFLITSAIWLPLAVGVLSVFMWLVPRDCREMVKESSQGKGLPLLSFVLLIPTVILVICLSPSFVASGLVALVALAMAWITAAVGRPAPPSDSSPDHH
jgi:hypothetical protein